ncbi:hypothetical protein [Kordiimonas sp.]|uniref:hypothetical protein n=1 Tax=Kordiimonas sp. TaxID=1970157 RepID=UPI003A93A792
MPNEFSIGGSFSTDPGYNPFSSGFGALASSAAGASGSLNPAVTTTSASSTASSSSRSSSSSGLSSVGDFLGGVLRSAVDTGSRYVDHLLTLDIFGKAQDKGIGNGTFPSTGTGGTGTNTATASGLPSWAIPAGIGAAVLIVVLLLMSSK